MAAAPVFVALAVAAWLTGAGPTLIVCNLLIALFLLIFDPF